jgi:hypothetical protein
VISGINGNSGAAVDSLGIYCACTFLMLSYTSFFYFLMEYNF